MGRVAWCAKAAWRLWMRLQVELQGKYSLDRLKRVEQYAHRVRWYRIACLCLLTPVPCTIVSLLLDLIRIEPVSRGARGSPCLWLRCTVSLWLATALLLVQQRSLMPRNVITKRLVVAVSTIASVGTMGVLFALAVRIGYPLPFTGGGGLVVWVVAIPLCLYMGSHLHGLLSSTYVPMNHQEVRFCAVLLVCQLVPICTYTIFNAGYVAAPSSYQLYFICALPFVKLAVKNAITYSLRELDDLKPETVIFNVDIFHALFVACAMQLSSTSMTNIASLVAIDILQSLVTLYDLQTLARELEPIRTKLANGARDANLTPVSIGSLLKIARFLAETDQSVQSNRTIRASCWRAQSATTTRLNIIAPLDGRRPTSRLDRNSSSCESTNSRRNLIAPTVGPVVLSSKKGPRVVAPMAPVPLKHSSSALARRPTLLRITSGSTLETPPQAQHLLNAYRSLDVSERLILVNTTLQIMYVTEFAVLVEYTEIIMPLVYVVCLVFCFYSPNRESFLFLDDVDISTLQETVRNVLLYTALEFVSLGVLSGIVWYQLRVSLVDQLAFVLDTQRINIQCKLMSWVIYILQTSLVQLGSDYTFAFTWLHDRTGNS